MLVEPLTGRLLVKAGAVARLLGMGSQTLRRWVRVGVVPAPSRTGSGWQVWDQADFAKTAHAVAGHLGGTEAQRKALEREAVKRWERFVAVRREELQSRVEEAENRRVPETA